MKLQNHGNEGKKERARRKKEKEEKKTMVTLLAEKQKKTSGTQLWKRKLTMDRVCKKLSKERPILNNYYQLYISQFQLRPAPPQGWPLALEFFFALDGKFPRVGILELSNPPGWGRFFVSINVFLCNSASILMKTSRRDDMHQFRLLVLIQNYWH